MRMYTSVNRMNHSSGMSYLQNQIQQKNENIMIEKHSVHAGAQFAAFAVQISR